MPRNISIPAGLGNSHLWGLSFIRNCKGLLPLTFFPRISVPQAGSTFTREVPCKNTSAKTPQNQLQSSLWLILHSSKEPFSSAMDVKGGARTQWPDTAITHTLAIKSLSKPTPRFTCSSFCDWSEGKGNNYTISNHHYCFNDCISILKA